MAHYSVFPSHFGAQQSIAYKEHNGKRSRIDNQDFSAKTRQVPNCSAQLFFPQMILILQNCPHKVLPENILKNETFLAIFEYCGAQIA